MTDCDTFATLNGPFKKKGKSQQNVAGGVTTVVNFVCNSVVLKSIATVAMEKVKKTNLCFW